MRWLMVYLLSFFPQVANAALPMVADFSSRSIEIHSRFTGTELMLFGARNEAGDIFIAVRGPAKDVVVRRKGRVAGMWVNRGAETFDNVPLYLALASSRPLDSLTTLPLMARLGIDSDYLSRPLPLDPRRMDYGEALTYLLEQDRLYQPALLPVTFMGQTLFKAEIPFPDNLPGGTYTAEIYLVDGQEIVAMQVVPLEVFKTGLDAWLYDLAQRTPLIYGLMAVLLAAITGWLVSRIFQRI